MTLGVKKRSIFFYFPSNHIFDCINDSTDNIQKHKKTTILAVRNPDVEVEAVLTTKTRSLEHAQLETSLSKLCCLQYTWGWKLYCFFLLSDEGMILQCKWDFKAAVCATQIMHSNVQLCCVRLGLNAPSQPRWGFGFSSFPGLAAKGIPLKTSTERKRLRGIFCPWTLPPSVCTTPS